jgi:hypothetical protein
MSDVPTRLVLTADLDALYAEVERLRAEKAELDAELRGAESEIGTLRCSLRIIMKTEGDHPTIKYLRYEASEALRIADEIKARAELHACRKQADIALAKAGGKE